MEKVATVENPREDVPPKKHTSSPPLRSNSNISIHQNHSPSPHPSTSSQPKRILQKTQLSLSSTTPLPKEQGRILSLLDNFGFIYCAQRPCDLFFHYSEYKGSLNQLHIGDEVEFYIGPSQQKQQQQPNSMNSKSTEIKISAFAVQKLESGTCISWYLHVEPKGLRRQGIVQRSLFSRSSNQHPPNKESSSFVQYGKIRLEQSNLQNNNTNIEQHPEEVLVEADVDILYQVTDISDPTIRLEKDDVVEFTLFQESRTKAYYAKEIIRILSKRERIEQEKERLLLQSATLEQGIVISLHSGGYGFLKSNKRKEDVYFKYCHVILPEVMDESTQEQDEKTAFTLREGQEMEFWVVSEVDKRDATKKIWSARQIQFLEKGTVIFEHVIAKSVLGTIETCPIIIQENDRRNYTLNESKGKVLLDTPITYIPPESLDPKSSTVVISEVELLARDAPGGIVYQEPSSLSFKASLWIRPGDRLMFDIIWNIADSLYRVAPMHIEQTSKDTTESSPPPSPPRVRFISPSLESRVQGYVATLKDNYGFLRLQDKSMDIYFKISDVLPRVMQEDMDAVESGIVTDLPSLRVGTAVSFDMSTQARGGHSKKKEKHSNKEKELVCAQRIKILSASLYSKKGWGVVTEVNHDTNFGVISISKGEPNICTQCKFSIDLCSTTYKNIKVGDEVIFEYHVAGTDDIQNAANVRVVPTGAGSTLISKNMLVGYILLEPSSFLNSNHSSKTNVSMDQKANAGAGRWKNVHESVKEEEPNNGRILLIYDARDINQGSTSVNDLETSGCELENGENVSDIDERQSVSTTEKNRTTLFYNSASVLHRRAGKRGDLVAFTREKNGKLKNIRVLKESAAHLVSGVIHRKATSEVIAVFNDNINLVLREILGCSLDSLKDNDLVEGILFEGNIYGSK